MRDEVGPLTVLLVEDEPLVRFDFADVLDSAGYRVTDFGGAPDAWSYLIGNPVDLLMTDIEMPGAFDGLELARRARHYRPTLPILIVSARPAQTLGEWAACLISKPVQSERLLERVRWSLQAPGHQRPEPECPPCRMPPPRA